MQNNKILFIIDMDHTILNGNTDYIIRDLITGDDLEFTKLKNLSWSKTMNEIFKKINLRKKTIQEIKEKVTSLDLNHGFKELFQFLYRNKEKFKVIILSGANTIFVKWIIEKFKLELIIDDICSYIGNEDKLNELFYIKDLHESNCQMCDIGFCKKKALLDRYLNEKYYFKVYIGDGCNDFCPITKYEINDLAFVKKYSPLNEMLNKQRFQQQVKCPIIYWESGLQIIDKLLEKNNNYN